MFYCAVLFTATYSHFVLHCSWWGIRWPKLVVEKVLVLLVILDALLRFVFFCIYLFKISPRAPIKHFQVLYSTHSSWEHFFHDRNFSWWVQVSILCLSDSKSKNFKWSAYSMKRAPRVAYGEICSIQISEKLRPTPKMCLNCSVTDPFLILFLCRSAVSVTWRNCCLTHVL